MSMTLKSDIINSAYSKLRISGLTVIPNAEDISIALNELESMAHEFEGRNMTTGYNFETEPDASSPHSLEKMYVMPYATMLAVRVMPYFGKAPDPVLLQQNRAASSFISSASALIRQTTPPVTMPTGSGNRLYDMNSTRFFPEVSQAPLSSQSHTLYVGDVEDYTESFEDYLKESETLSSYTISAGSGVTISNDSLTTPIVSYRAEADATGSCDVTVTVTTSTGRVSTRVINFEVVD